MIGRIAIRTASALAGLAACASLAQAQAPAAIPFTEDQASRGQAVYQTSCAACHGPAMQGGPGGPPLNGPGFRGRWDPHRGDVLFNFLRQTMPPGAPGSLSAEAYADVLAYVLKANGGSAGQAPLPADPQRLASLSVAAGLPAVKPTGRREPAPVLEPDATAKGALQARAAFLRKLRPVTDDMLRNPPQGSWINWRHSYDAAGFSPLTQIDRGNVGKLQVAWAWQLGGGANEVTPLVHDGVVFMVQSGRLQALDAATGDLLWQYVRPGPSSYARNLAIYGENIYFAAETDMVALDMRTGKVVWERRFGAPESGIRFSSGPIAAKGKIFQGMGNCYFPHPGGCFILALDAATGQELWRFNTIARPGEPGGDTWNGAPLNERFGSSIWIAGSYDPELDLLFFGTSQTYKTATLIRGGGVEDRADGLYTDTTLALRPDTGQLVWHYQHLRGDIWDLDWAFERTLATINVDGKPRRTVTTAGKIGIFDTLDAATGRYLFSYDLGMQTLVESIDPKTGEKKVFERLRPEPFVEKSICVARNWPATAYNPRTGVVFVPANASCMLQTWRPGPGGNDWSSRRGPADPQGMIGRVEAFDLASRRRLWTLKERPGHTSAMLATAGGLVFDGNRERWFRALDDRTGKVLWKTRLSAQPSSFPISYSVDGVQYVAVTAGGGGPADGNAGIMTPEILAPADGTTLWVFRLPERERGRK